MSNGEYACAPKCDMRGEIWRHAWEQLVSVSHFLDFQLLSVSGKLRALFTCLQTCRRFQLFVGSHGPFNPTSASSLLVMLRGHRLASGHHAQASTLDTGN